jgi:hypothetical protein
MFARGPALLRSRFSVRSSRRRNRNKHKDANHDEEFSRVALEVTAQPPKMPGSALQNEPAIRP